MGIVILVAIGAYRKVTNAIPANHYGMCRGLIEGPNDGQVLTPWLSKLINETAGMNADGNPLTFGDLWGQIETSWDNHRWVRYRSMMGLVEEMLNEIEFAIKNPAPGDRSYEDLILRDLKVAPTSYKWNTKSEQTFAHKATGELMTLIAKWQSLKATDHNATFTTGTPNPKPELRVKPRV